MKNNLRPFMFIILFSTTLLSGFIWINKKQNGLQFLATPTSTESPKEIKEMEEKMLADPATGKIPTNIYFQESLFAKQLLQAKSGSQTKSSDPWTLRGPWNVGGRTRAFAIDATNENVLLAGGVSGGLWRSTDAGASWTRVTDRSSKPDVVAIAQDTRVGHTNTWYYLSGEAYGTSASGGSSFYLGDGMFKSTDGGLTWNPVASTAGGNPFSFSTNWQVTWNLVTDKSNLVNDELYAAVYDGIYRSIDGGTSWTQVLHGNANSSYFTDVAINDSGVVYATLSSDGDDRGIWRSTDGIIWANIIPTSNFPINYDLIKIGINPSNQNEVYFLMGGTDTVGLKTVNAWGDKEWNSFYKYTYVSGDGSGSGGTWRDLTMSLPHGIGVFDDFHAQGSYNLVVKVKPNDPATVFVGATNIYRSTDSFSTPNNVTHVGGYGVHTQLIGFKLYPNHHPDQHDIWFVPSNPNKMYSACDGGVYRADSCMNPTVRWTKLNNGYLSTQFYTTCVLHDYTSDVLFGGLQDNGIFWTDNKTLTTPWKMPFNGDGSYLATSADDQTYYFSIQQGKIIKAQIDATATITQFARIDPRGASRTDYQFINPFILDPNDDKIMYLPAGRKLWRNDDLNGIPFAGNYDSISTNWTMFPDTVLAPNSISAIACSNANPAHTVYYGTETRKVYRIDNANTGTPTRVDITGSNFPSGFVTCIAVDPNDGNKVVVAFSNYGIYSIFYSVNAGTSWIKVAGNLEQNYNGGGNGPSIRWISILPYQGGMKYFAGTSIGLYSADSLTLHDNTHLGTHWTQEGVTEIGQAIVPYIYIRPADNMVAVATHGSGVYTCHYGYNVGVGKIENIANDISIYPNPAVDFVNVKCEIEHQSPLEVVIYDLSGRRKFSQNYNSISKGNFNQTISTADFATGTYILQMKAGDKQWSKKIVVQK